MLMRKDEIPQKFNPRQRSASNYRLLRDKKLAFPGDGSLTGFQIQSNQYCDYMNINNKNTLGRLLLIYFCICICMSQ